MKNNYAEISFSHLTECCQTRKKNELFVYNPNIVTTSPDVYNVCACVTYELIDVLSHQHYSEKDLPGST